MFWPFKRKPKEEAPAQGAAPRTGWIPASATVVQGLPARVTRDQIAGLERYVAAARKEIADYRRGIYDRKQSEEKRLARIRSLEETADLAERRIEIMKLQLGLEG